MIEFEVKEVFARDVNILLTEKDELMDNAQTIISFLCDHADLEQRQTDLFYCLGRGEK